MKRTLIVFAITIAMVSAVPSQTVHGILMSAEELAVFNSTNYSDTSSTDNQTKGFARTLGAPFRALGRLFGGGKKKRNKPERISAKDIEKFTSVPSLQASKTDAVATRAPTRQPAAGSSQT